jgi:hypothetical protein
LAKLESELFGSLAQKLKNNPRGTLCRVCIKCSVTRSVRCVSSVRNKRRRGSGLAKCTGKAMSFGASKVRVKVSPVSPNSRTSRQCVKIKSHKQTKDTPLPTA